MAALLAVQLRSAQAAAGRACTWRISSSRLSPSAAKHARLSMSKITLLSAFGSAGSVATTPFTGTHGTHADRARHLGRPRAGGQHHLLGEQAVAVARQRLVEPCLRRRRRHHLGALAHRAARRHRALDERERRELGLHAARARRVHGGQRAAARQRRLEPCRPPRASALQVQRCARPQSPAAAASLVGVSGRRRRARRRWLNSQPPSASRIVRRPRAGRAPRSTRRRAPERQRRRACRRSVRRGGRTTPSPRAAAGAEPEAWKATDASTMPPPTTRTSIGRPPFARRSRQHGRRPPPPALRPVGGSSPRGSRRGVARSSTKLGALANCTFAAVRGVEHGARGGGERLDAQYHSMASLVATSIVDEHARKRAQENPARRRWGTHAPQGL